MAVTLLSFYKAYHVYLARKYTEEPCWSQTLNRWSSPICKIIPFSKITVTIKPVMRFGCPDAINIFFPINQWVMEVFVDHSLASPGLQKTHLLKELGNWKVSSGKTSGVQRIQLFNKMFYNSYSMTIWLTHWLTDRLTDSLTQWLTDSLTHWMPLSRHSTTVLTSAAVLTFCSYLHNK